MDREAKSGTVKVSLEFYSPVLAQKWLTLLVADLNEYMRNKERDESQRSIEYLQAQVEKSKVADLRNVFYQLIQEQTQKAMLAEAREEFVYKTLDKAIVPELKSKPKRALIVIILTFIGGLLSLFVVHAMHAMQVRKTVKEAEMAQAGQ
jgi:LPS O-antigen subunit length determinant protein (WzzB/FepE family)